MKKRFPIFRFAPSVAFLALTSISANIAALPAFPSAEGYGTQTTGGRGGTICEVTTLNDTGFGSLRDCVEMQTGPRTVVFRVGGTIALTRDIVINAARSYLTIAGQTATGGGIQLRNWGFAIKDGGHDIVIRYLRVRPGSNACIAQGGGACDSVNAFTLLGSTIEKRVYNVVLDHISAQWGVDQNMNVWDSVSDVTIQNSIIAAGATAGHSKGSHSMGFLAGGDIAIDTTHPRTISIHHSLFAHNEDRNPRVNGPTIFDFRNNVVYYSRIAANFKMESSLTPYPAIFNTTKVNFINNVYKKSPTSGNSFMLELDDKSRVYLSGNFTPAYPTGTANNFTMSNINGRLKNINQLAAPIATPAVTTDATNQVLTKVLANVGARLPTRDSIDTRLMNDVLNGTGVIGQDQNNWPTLANATAPVDTDRDGMPDVWETAQGLNPNDAIDRNGDNNNNGYTNVEDYLNSLAQ